MTGLDVSQWAPTSLARLTQVTWPALALPGADYAVMP